MKQWMWKEAVVAEFEVLTQHFPGGREGNYEGLRDSRILAEVWAYNYHPLERKAFSSFGLPTFVLAYINTKLDFLEHTISL
jgi:hypothetical protein